MASIIKQNLCNKPYTLFPSFLRLKQGQVEIFKHDLKDYSLFHDHSNLNTAENILKTSSQHIL